MTMDLTRAMVPVPRRSRATLRGDLALQLSALLLALLMGVLSPAAGIAAPGPVAAEEAPQAGSSAASAATVAGGLTLPADRIQLEAGGKLFEAHCVGCHVGGGNVIRRGRTLRRAALERAGLADPAAIARVAAGGIGQMSGYGTVLGEEGARQVGDWVWLQALSDWPRQPRLEPLP